VIGTVDFFPPLVADPATFGAIAAANACSDVFAMGGRVLFALSVAAFPAELPADVMAAILGGAAEVVREAGGTLAGGHTIRDPEPKFGLAVVGVAHPDHLLRKGGARPGDVLLLTKPLGTGLLVSGARQGMTAPADLEGAIASMRRLNRAAADVLVGAGIRAATDVTGFGLLGHGLEMARASGVRLIFDAAPCRRFPGRSPWRRPAWRRAGRPTTAASWRLPWRSRPGSPSRSSRWPTTRRPPRPARRGTAGRGPGRAGRARRRRRLLVAGGAGRGREDPASRSTEVKRASVSVRQHRSAKSPGASSRSSRQARRREPAGTWRHRQPASAR